jgi:hypothetical protein
MADGKSAEPLSRAALEVLRKKYRPDSEIDALFGFIETERTRRVFDQLKRYCRGEQDGVSILISGTRGMGKTTMAKLVVQRLITEDTKMIPLPLILHGPTLLRPDDEADPPRRVPELATLEEKRLVEEHNQIRLKRWVLRGLIAALYQHVCTHIVEAWENAIDPSNPLVKPPENAIDPSNPRPRLSSRQCRRLNELRQLKAHLALKLEEAPNVSTLRKIWRRAGFLHDGVLRHLYRCRQEKEKEKQTYSWPADQGVREITALAACALSYLTIIGAPEETVSNVTASTATMRTAEREAPKAEAKPEKPAGGESKGDTVSEQVKRLAPPTLATLAATAIGVANPEKNFGWALGAGLFVYLLGLVSSRFTMRRDQFAELRRRLVVTVDWSERRLERELPALLRRVKDAGLAPIFVLDELDKVENVEEKLDDFLFLSKHIVRDHAAFLFLTHRDYFEWLFSQPQNIPGGTAPRWR